MRSRWTIFVVTLALAGSIGYWLAGTAVPRRPQKPDAATSETGPKRTVVADEKAPRFRRAERPAASRRDDEAMEAGALPGQRILVFKDQAALENFLKRAGERIRLMGRLDALNALRIGFSDPGDLAGLLDADSLASFVYPVDIPPPGDAAAQPGAVALGAGLLDWLGISGDNSAWGNGVKIAVLDTGVTANSAFSSKISSINFVDLPADLSTQNGHGTGVASMILGNGSLTPGVAPGAPLISIRIANDLGQSDSFLLAQGIVAAVDAGARLINISLGSPGDSGLVRNAIEYARAAGAMIVAAAGNNGIGKVSYPAANDGVIAVGAVDALGNHLDFSNTGRQVAISAPGFGVNAAWTGDQAASVSGTSFSSPIIVGAIAAVMSQPGSKNLTNRQALNLIYAYLNDGGEAGTDAALGAGMPDLGRVLNRGTPGIFDAAVASQRILPPSPGNPYGQVEVLVQNRGTEPLVNASLQISTPGGMVTSNISTLAVNAVRTVRVPITQSTAASLRYDSRVRLADGRSDAKPSNDRRVETYVPAVKK
ncbi:S8 family serine peptidase [bacterium]|nr:S8 family serine peptidase [bacterium]